MADSLSRRLLQSEAQQLCKVLEKSISNMEDLVNIKQFFPHADEECGQLSHLVRDTLHQGFLFGFEVGHEEERGAGGGSWGSEGAGTTLHFVKHFGLEA